MKNKITILVSLLLVIAFLGITSPAQVFAEGDEEPGFEETCEVAGGEYWDFGDGATGCDLEGEGGDVICVEGEEDCTLGTITALDPEVPDEPSPETNIRLAIGSTAASVLIFGITLIALRMSSKVALKNLSTSVVIGGGTTTLFAVIGLALVMFWTAGGLLSLLPSPTPDVDFEPRAVIAEPRVFGVHILPLAPIPVPSLTPTSEAQGLTPTFTFTPDTPTITLAPPTKTPVPPTPTETAIALGSLSGVIWKDANGNGHQDSKEFGYSGVIVRLGQGPCSSTGFKSTTTSANGIYSFTGLPAGTYCVSVNIPLSCNEVTSPTTATQYEVTLNPGDAKERSFGYQIYVC